jgi:hypothetical protein
MRTIRMHRVHSHLPNLRTVLWIAKTNCTSKKLFILNFKEAN